MTIVVVHISRQQGQPLLHVGQESPPQGRPGSGSSTLIIGPAGTGKSLLVLQFVTAAVKRGEHAALFIFDEELGLLFPIKGNGHRSGVHA